MVKIGTRKQDDTLVIFVSGRLDSAGAPDAERDILAACAEAPHGAVVLDAEALEYISSAGLRVVLKLRKEEPTLTLINVPSDVYDIFEMTGFTEMIPVQKAYRRFSVDGCVEIGHGAKGVVYRYNDDTVIKVYKNPDSLPDIKKEQELAKRAFVLGIPTAISYDVVKVGESFGTVFELLEAKSYTEMIREDAANRAVYIRDYALLLQKIHATTVRPEDMPDIKPYWTDSIDRASVFLTSEQTAKIRALIDAVPKTMRMLHCDYHTNNVMLQKGETLLIDMDTLSHGHPIFDLAGVYITYVGFGVESPAKVENFLQIPYEDAKRIWKEFLPIYLGTEDAAIVADVEAKAKLLADVRLLKHLAKSGAADTESGRNAIDVCRAEIADVLSKIDTLTF